MREEKTGRSMKKKSKQCHKTHLSMTGRGGKNKREQEEKTETKKK